MGQKMLKRLQQLGVVMLGAYLVSGCPSSTAGSLFGRNGSLAQEAIAQESTESLDSVESLVPAVPFEVCAAVESWQRPSAAEQSKQINGDSRYAEVLVDDPTKATSTQFWDHQVISFTTYGLSARMEPEQLSGIWTVSDELLGCYEPETAMAINEGDRAETWLLNQRITDLQWQDDHYVMTVEPSPTGMQVVLFDRVDAQASLPLDVVTENGDVVDVFSGDWQ